MRRKRWCIFPEMDRWTISDRSAILLVAALIVIVLVLVLPQVDLLDTAFHLGTAPILVHAQGTAKPVLRASPSLFGFFLSVAGAVVQRSDDRFLSFRTHEVGILNHCFRC